MTPEVTAVVLMENFVEKQEVVTNCDHLAPETLFDRSTPLQTN
jgi:hypothetical protein